jgi:hypothetical protein
VRKRIMSAVNRVEFVGGSISYILRRGSWCDILVLNVHASKMGESNHMKDSFY